MSCDIHPYVEMMGSSGWQAVEPINGFSYARLFPANMEGAARYRLQWRFGPCSYDCFAVMAGVRNENEMRMIAKPRGVPPDATPTVAEAMKNPDWHSHSWLDLPEILSFDFDQVALHEGLVDEKEFRRYLETGAPESYSAALSVPSRDITFATNREMRRMMDSKSCGNHRLFTVVSWNWTYRRTCQQLIRFAEALKSLGDPDRTRVVFAFDN